jgi:hypothetical protein
MGNIRIKITEITIPNDFRIYYKAGTDVVGFPPGINPYPLNSGYTDYGQIFTGGTTTIDLIGDFVYGQVYWIMGQEIEYPERWMVKNILINDEIAYRLGAPPTPSMSITPTVTPSLSISATPSVTPTVTPSLSISATISPSLSISATPSPSLSISATPTITPTISPSTSQTVFYYKAAFYNCSIEYPIGFAGINTSVNLTVDKFYRLDDPSADIVYIYDVYITGPDSIVLTEPVIGYDSYDNACAS